MNCLPSLLTNTLVAGSMLAAGASARAEDFASYIENEWFRAWPPASVTYSFPSELRADGSDLGDLDTVTFQAAYIASIKQSEHFNWLLGARWQRVQASVPSGIPLPDTLQSAAAVVGFDWFFRDGWRARLEVLPGVYSDFSDFSGDDINAPFNVEVSYEFGPDLLVGAQLNVNARRESPLLGAVGVRWKFAEDWLLSLWFPRPRIEYFPADNVTLFASADLVGGTFVVGIDIASQTDQPLDYQAIRVGGGLRYAIKHKLALEISGGWTVEQRFDYFERNLEFESDGAPYVQIGFGLTF